MKNFKLLLSILFVSALFFPSLAFAHLLKSDGNIGAVLHIDPDDDPIAEQQAGLFFEFKDKQGKFSSQNCDCTFSIIEGGKELFSQPLFQNNNNPDLANASVFYTFPEKNVYQVKITGKPNTPGAFQAFNLSFDVRVDKEAPVTTSVPTNNIAAKTQINWFSGHSLHLVAGIIMLAFIIFVLIKQQFDKQRE